MWPTLLILGEPFSRNEVQPGYLAPNPKKLSAFWDLTWVKTVGHSAAILKHSWPQKKPGFEIVQNPRCFTSEINENEEKKGNWDSKRL